MTFDQLLLIIERIGIPTAGLLALLYFTVRYIWPFITDKAWPFITGLIETGRKERIEERDKFLKAIDRLVNERDQEREEFIDSLRDRDDRLISARDLFLDHLRDRDQKFEPVVKALSGLANSVSDLHQLIEECTSAISISISNVQKQIAEISTQRPK